jgi:hypothetical protein
MSLEGVKAEGARDPTDPTEVLASGCNGPVALVLRLTGIAAAFTGGSTGGCASMFAGFRTSCHISFSVCLFI